jgi:hypothetical protein
MFRIVRVPPTIDQMFTSVKPSFCRDHRMNFRLLILVFGLAWWQNVANLYRYLDASHQRARFNSLLLVTRWDPEAALC